MSDPGRAGADVPAPEQLAEPAGGDDADSTARAGVDSLLRLAAMPGAGADLKVAATAVAEIERAATVFGPGRGRLRVGFFGSSQVPPGDPLYEQARLLGELAARRGWMVITGAGPGLMLAANHGAGAEASYGVNIQLRSAARANDYVEESRHTVHKYFFTRKLTLVRESSAFVVMPGGFGTADEAFELLTLAQMGKMPPAPIILLDQPGGCYWQRYVDFIRQTMLEPGYVRQDSMALFRVLDSAAAAVAEIERFHSNYQCLHWHGEHLVLHLRHEPAPAALEALSAEFGDIAGSGISSGSAHPVRCDTPGLAALSLHFKPRRFGRLRQLIDALNSAPAR